MFGIAGLIAAGFSLAADPAKDLPAGTTGIGRPAADRAWWAPYANAPEAKKILQNAESSLKSPMPPFDAERYLDFTKNGDRTRYQTINLRRWGRLTRLVMGECLAGSGRFVPAIEETVKSLCADPSWVLPAHDPGARVFKGGAPHADLGVAMNGYQIALARWLLADRLSAEISELIRANVTRRLTGPVLATIDGTAPAEVLAGHFWARANHNWNAVCTAGAVGAILATETSPETRAKAIDWASRNMDLFLSGFGADGYCSEGLGYWGYGFGHFALLAENLRTQTGGKLDLYQRPQVRKIVDAARQLEITGGIFPAFADSSLNTRPSSQLLELLDWRLDGRPFPETSAGGISESILLYDMLAYMDIASAYPSAGLKKLERTWTYQRSGDGELTIVDVFAFGQPASFATAWTGLGDWYLLAENDHRSEFLIIEADGAALHLEVTFSGKGAWELRNIENPDRPTVKRLGLSLADQAAAGFIRTVIRPSVKGPDATARKLAASTVPAKLSDPAKAPEPQ